MILNDASRHPHLRRSFQPLVHTDLPVFACEREEYAAFYAPGFVCVVPRRLAAAICQRIGELLVDGLNDAVTSAPGDSVSATAAKRIVVAAQNAAKTVSDRESALFSPECLTLFLNNACNLECRYCHAAPGTKPDQPIKEDTIRAASALVAASCAQRRCPFTLAFHGGGEPALERYQADRIIEIAREEAANKGVELRTYIATNGVMSAEQAHWLAGRFDLVGLSCDGPPEVQDRQRPARGGGPTSEYIKRSAEILQRAGKPFHVRATVTRDSIGRQAEIAAYFIAAYAPAEIRLEPVYENAFGGKELSGDDSERFVANFLAATRVGTDRRVPVTTSMTRPAAVYGRYCNVLRHVLNLAPGGIATACFLESRETGIVRRRVRVGGTDGASARFELDQKHIAQLVARCSEIPRKCSGCLCRFQCTYGCPDVCILKAPPDDPAGADIAGGFRCRANRLLGEALIQQAAETVWRAAAAGKNREMKMLNTMISAAVYHDADAEEGIR
jgi:sulfatase maturation enzyme AslB (radical SAM superfamily)